MKPLSNIINGQFDDPLAYQEVVTNAGTLVRPATKKTFNGQYSREISGDVIHAVHKLGVRTTFEGAVRAGYFHLGVCLGESTINLLNSDRIAVAIGSGDEMYSAKVEAGTESHAFHIPEDNLNALLMGEDLSAADLPFYINRRPALRKALYLLLSRYVAATKTDSTNEQFLKEFVYLLLSQEGCHKSHSGTFFRTRILKDAINFIAAQDPLKRSLKVPDVASAVHCSVRSLEYCFMQAFEMTVKDYLKRHSMFVAFDVLRKQGRDFDSMTHFYQHYQISSPGRFAQEFHQWFGKYPKAIAANQLV